MAEIEVGSVENWVENRVRPYYRGKSIFTEQLDDEVMVRL